LWILLTVSRGYGELAIFLIFIASCAIAQLGVFKGFQLKTKSTGVSIAQSESANALRRLAEKEFEKRFSGICAIAP